jgi:hypothetical protein
VPWGKAITTSHQRHPKAEVTSFVQNGRFRV